MTKLRQDGLPWTETIVVNCRIPRSLHAQIKLLLIDPSTGAARPRGWSAVIEEGMKLWLEKQNLAPRRPLTSRHDFEQ